MESAREWELLIVPINDDIKTSNFITKEALLSRPSPRIFIQVVSVLRSPDVLKKRGKRLKTPKVALPTHDDLSDCEFSKRSKLENKMSRDLISFEKTNPEEYDEFHGKILNSGNLIRQLIDYLKNSET